MRLPAACCWLLLLLLGGICWAAGWRPGPGLAVCSRLGLRPPLPLLASIRPALHPTPTHTLTRLPSWCSRVVLFLAGADSSVSMVGLDKGEPIGRPMRPKNASRPLALALLDAAGWPLPPLHGPLVLHWCRNCAAAPPRSLAMTKVASLREAGSTARMGRLRCGALAVWAAQLAGARLACAALLRLPGWHARRHVGPPRLLGSCMRALLTCPPNRSLSERPLPSPLPAGASRRSTGADSHRSWTGADSTTDPGEGGGRLPACCRDPGQLRLHPCLLACLAPPCAACTHPSLTPTAARRGARGQRGGSGAAQRRRPGHAPGGRHPGCG